MKYKTTIKREQSQGHAWTLPSVSSFDVVKLLRYSLLSLLVMLCGNVFADNSKLTIDFESEISAYTAWNITTIKTQCTNSSINAHGGSYYGGTDGKTTGSIETIDIIAKPQSIQFYISKESTNTTASSWIVEVSSDKSTWTQVLTQSASSGLTKGEWTEVNADLKTYNNVYVRVRYEGTTAKRTIDDLTIEYIDEDSNDTRAATTIEFSNTVIAGAVYKYVDFPTATVKAGETAIEDAQVEWSISDATVAENVRGRLHLLKAGTAVIQASYAGTETEYKPCTMSYTLTVTEKDYNAISALQIDATTTATQTTFHFNGQQVVFVDGNYAYLSDSGHGAFINTTGHGLEAGQVLTGTTTFKYNLNYSNSLQLTYFSKEGLQITTAEVVPAEMSIAEISASCQSTLLKLKNVVYKAKTKAFYSGKDSILYYNKFNVSNVQLVDGKKYDVTGIIILYVKDNVQMIEIAPRSLDDIVVAPDTYQAYFKAMPHMAGTVTATPSSETYVAGTQVSLSQEANEGWEFVNWTGGPDGSTIISTDATCTVTISSDTTICANFQEKQVTPEGFKDFAIDLMNSAGLTGDEIGATNTKGIAVTDGVGTLVAENATNSVATIKGGDHKDAHGWTNFVATVKVDGPVKITFGTCAWGGNVTVKDADGKEVVNAFSTNTGVCYHQDKEKNIVSAIYKGEATTLTIAGGAYVPYFAVESVNPEELAPSYTLTFSAGEGEGVLPESLTLDEGDEVEIEPNTNLYKEGYTLTGWSDGTNTYKVGDKFTITSDMTLTAQFEANTVSLADRKSAVHLEWPLGESTGAGIINLQGKTGFIVCQADIDGTKIDVKLDIDATSGKFNNVGRGDQWAQVNAGTKLTIPSCKGAHISLDAYGEIKTTTIDGQTDYTPGTHVDYTIASAAEAIDIIVQDGSYYSMIKVDLPVVQQEQTPVTYENEAAAIVWNFNDASNYATVSSVSPEGAFSTTAFDLGGATVSGTGTSNNLSDVTFVKIKPASGASDQIAWTVKPAAGLTFTPVKVSGKINRGATDVDNGITISVKAGNGEPITLGNYTALRYNRNLDGSNGVEKDKKADNKNIANSFEIKLTAEQQNTLSTTDEFTLFSTIGVGAGKEGFFSDIHIEGLLNGTMADVAKYTLATVASPEASGNINIYPVSEQYEEGSEVTLTATENFGYDFVNWTNAAGEEVSTEAKFKYTVNANETLTANFKAVDTYELALTVDGTNDYMVTVNPAPTVVDGKNMYEAGTAVQLNANQYEGLVTFTNWSDGETNASKLISMTANAQITAIYTQADIIAGWDFYKRGGDGRKADFYAQDNDADALSLVKTEDGTTSGWLDKSTEAGGGYESFKGAAVNWRTGTKNGDVGNYHWQTKINAEAFTDINVQFQMLYNYNAYQTYNVEYSLNGEDWTKAGSITMSGAKAPASFSGKLPEAANNQKELSIRLIADKTSNVDGAASANDGNTLAMFFITGSPKLVDDPVAPALVSSVPANNTTGASAIGKIVLNFDKKVQIAEGTKATLGTKELTPAVSGKVITFEYKGLEYATEYTFTLPANTVKNLTGATLTEAITIKFTTMERPAVNKGTFDAVVENVDQLVAAIDAAQKRADKNVRYRIFIKNGTYTLPRGNEKSYRHTNGKSGSEEVVYWEGSKTDPITYINTNNVSFIGESRDGVIITNDEPDTDEFSFTGAYGKASVFEGIGNSDVFQLRGEGYYWQDLTVETGMADSRGRDIAIQDRGTKNIYKNVGLRGYQDTWTSNNDNGLYYFEGGYVRGRTDYMCGKGDIFFNAVELRQIAGGYAAVPSKPAKYGWIYKDCVINGEGAGVDGNYTLGRPWGSGTPVALFIDTKMNVVPSAIGWNEMSNGWPKRFAEFNSTTKTGSVIDLSSRKKTFGEGHENNPVLTAEEALEAGNMHNMFGEWDPSLATEQAPSPKNVKVEGTTLSWDDSQYAFCWAVVKNGSVITFTTEPTYTIDDATAIWSVRAANEMGGLGEAIAAEKVTGINVVEQAPVLNKNIYNLQGIRVEKATKGLYIINGKKVVR